MRKIIFHYHLFKNAGTSVDELLQYNFPDSWVTKEFVGAGQTANLSQVENWVLQEPEAVAFSSHTAMLPSPKLQNTQFFPILFVRHPLDRIASAYRFERKQGGESFGSVLASYTSMAGYIDVRLALAPDRQCRNFHAVRLGQMFQNDGRDDRTRALEALDALPFIGLVDEFDASVQHLSDWLRPHFPDFKPMKVEKNVTRDSSISLERKLEEIRSEIGSDCYERLLEANRLDLEIYDKVKRSYVARR